MKKIAIVASIKSTKQKRMLDTFGEAFNVQFEVRPFGDDTGISAWIFLDADYKTICNTFFCKRPCYVIVSEKSLHSSGEGVEITFSKDNDHLNVLRGRTIETDEAIKLKVLPGWLKNTTAIASKEGKPFWTMLKVGEHTNYYISLKIPDIKDEEPIFKYFNGSQFIALLPLLIFLRSLDNDEDWAPPPLNACFMFDDPNLHWRSYGFIDFIKLAQHAQQFNYHVAFATIPLDSWFFHASTVSLFKQHRNRLSLLIHGNDHVTEELNRSGPEKEAARVLQQALWRVERFERQSGLPVSRIMAAPHGACNEKFLLEMARLGFESACISSGSLYQYNNQAMWVKTIGLSPSDNIKGLTIFPRFRLSKNCYHSILIAALLHQPIILVGHHYDLAEGLQLLADISQFIQSLGDVHWMDLRQISRSHFAKKNDGKILHIKMYSKRVEVHVPDEIKQICVHGTWLKSDGYEPFGWRICNDPNTSWAPIGISDTISVESGQRIEIISCSALPNNLKKRPFQSYHLWPFIRRLLTESRDRIAPILRGI